MNAIGNSLKEDRPQGPILAPLSLVLTIFAAAVFFFVLAGRIDQVPIPGQLGPAFWPKTILIFLMVSCGIKALEVVGTRKKGAVKASGIGRVNVPKLTAMIGVLFAGVFLMDVIGFAAANFLFMLAFLILAGVRKTWSLLLTSLLGTVFLLYLFVKIVYLPLPKGMWFFDDVTISLYRVLHIF